MSGSSSIQLKEINVSMAGRANNGNYGHVEPFVALKFEMPADLENWDEAMQQCISVAHDAFFHAAATMLAGYDGRREPEDMLAELGISSATNIVPIIDGDDEAVINLALAETANELDEGLTFEELFELDDDDADDADDDFDDEDDGDVEDFDDDLDYVSDEPDDDIEDTREVDTSHLTS